MDLVKISQLNVATSAAITDVIAIVSDPSGTPASKKIALANLFKSLGLGSDANGDIYMRAAGVLSRLPVGSEGQVLKIVSGLPAWGTNTATAAPHASTHATGGTDALTPSDIGAQPAGSYAPATEGVTNGNSHNHDGGDGGQIDHTKLSSIGANSHTQIDNHIGSTSNPHGVTKAQVGLTSVTDDAQVKRSEMGASSGVATLDSAGRVPSAQLPALAISDTHVVGSEAEMLALTAEVGDVAVRTDSSKTYILQTDGPSVLGHWVEVLTPPAPVQSVNGKTGTVSLGASDVGLGNLSNDAQVKKIASATDGDIPVFDGTTGAAIKDSGQKLADFAAVGHTHSGVYEPVDTTILRQADLAGSGSANTPAKSDHNHTGTYQPAAAILTPNIQNHTPDAGATCTLDLGLSNVHHITMPAGNISLAIQNGTPGQCFIVRILQDAVGSRTVTAYPGTVRWAGGSAPTLTTSANKADTLGFEVTGSGTLDGFVVGQNI